MNQTPQMGLGITVIRRSETLLSPEYEAEVIRMITINPRSIAAPFHPSGFYFQVKICVYLNLIKHVKQEYAVI